MTRVTDQTQMSETTSSFEGEDEVPTAITDTGSLLSRAMRVARLELAAAAEAEAA
jgi:hypothetical protein